MARFPSFRQRPNADLAYKQPKSAGGPTINRGKGNNNASTPWEFIYAVERKFGRLYADLACTTANMKAARGLCADEGTNSLDVDWAKYLGEGLGWDNPPFFNIAPWAKWHAHQVQRGARTLLLAPASVGANWFEQWVWPFADVYSVGRMVFDDCYDKDGELITTPYIKDLILCHYDWRNETLRTGERLLFWKEWNRA